MPVRRIRDQIGAGSSIRVFLRDDDLEAPVRIEPAPVEIPKSQRAEREKQVPLFENLPDSLLPPLNLLDEAQKAVDVMPADTLEFTSRLIEKKLLDFGVEVKVVAAYPGPVISRYEVEPAVVEESDGTRSYWALKHPPGRPDFHHAAAYALDLAATVPSSARCSG